jgi:hypothetical protein
MNFDKFIEMAKGRVKYRIGDIFLENLDDDVLQRINNQVTERISFAMEQAIMGATSILKTKAETYINALHINEDCLIGIDEEHSWLEYGYERYQMLAGLLTGPKSKVSKDGHLYTTIPIGGSRGTNLAGAIAGKVSEVFQKGSEIRADKRTLTDIKQEMRNVLRPKETSPSKPKFRVASDKQDDSSNWVNPGFEGVNQLESINRMLEEEIISDITKVLEDVAQERDEGEYSWKIWLES